MARYVFIRGHFPQSPLKVDLRTARNILNALSETVYHEFEAQVRQRAGSARTRGRRFASTGGKLKGLVA